MKAIARGFGRGGPHRRWRCALALICGLGVVSPLSAKTWTDAEGRTITADLKMYSPRDESVVVSRAGKEFRLPLAKLSEADREFVLRWYEAKVTAKRGAIEGKVGKFPEWKLTRRAFPSVGKYLEDPIVKKAAEAYARVDGPIEDIVGYRIEEEAAALHVPRNYDGVAPFGVYVFMSSGRRGWSPPGAYEKIFEKHHLICVSAHRSANKEPIFRRMALALDSLASVRAHYEVDPQRFFVGGASGGGALSTYAAFFYPRFFKASFNMVRGSFIKEYELKEEFMRYAPGMYRNQLDYLTPGEVGSVASKHPRMRWAFISGPKDYNYLFTKIGAQQWRERGFDARFFDVPGMGHAVAPPDWFEKALLWGEGREE